MAEEVTVLVWCDVCGTAERTPARPYKLNGARLDLCEVHRVPVEAALALFAEHGRKEKTAPIEPLACPDCDKPYRTAKALREHRKKLHGFVVGKPTPVEPPEKPVVAPRKGVGPFPCPECGRSFPTAQGLQVHRARSHKTKGA